MYLPTRDPLLKVGRDADGHSPERAVTANAFRAAPAPVEDRRSALARVLDSVNAQWGRATLGIGSAGLGGDRRWAMRRDMLSPRYTTRRDELPIAKA